jgi:hypothetical protein
MEAGMNNIDLDRWLAENVMGWQKETIYNWGNPEADYGVWYSSTKDDWEYGIEEWHPTTNLLQAMECVDKMIADGCGIEIESGLYNLRNESRNWLVTIDGNDTEEYISNPSLPLAICEAIYRAKGGKE